VSCVQHPVAGTQRPSFVCAVQVFISYGPQTSDSLMQYYGFLEDENEHDIYTFRDFRRALLATGLADEQRIREIEAHRDKRISGALESLPMTVRAQVTDNVKAALRYAVGAAVTIDSSMDKISNAADAVVWEAVGLVVAAERQWLEGRGGLAQRDLLEARIASEAGDARKALIARYRACKKEFLRAREEQIMHRVARMRGGGAEV
jgi:pyruvate/2-oxoacid:ferredoxin oxidoreductase alpha subunit